MVRVMWYVILILVGFYVYHKAMDTGNPSSFISIDSDFNRVLDEDSKIP